MQVDAVDKPARPTISWYLDLLLIFLKLNQNYRYWDGNAAQGAGGPVNYESLVSREFHLSISRYFNFIFILDLDFEEFSFHFSFSKRVKEKNATISLFENQNLDKNLKMF